MHPDEAELWALVERRCRPDADHAAIDAQIWQRYGAERAIMYTDLSGFSRRSAEFGIIHFLEVIYESLRLFRPVIEAGGGRLVKTEADSLLVRFHTASSALDASFAMQDACAAFNRDRPPEEQVLLCVGLGYGPVLCIGDVDMYGEQVNAASKLGEDTARAGEILVSDAFRVAVGPRDGLAYEPIPERVPGSILNHRVRVR